jgi:hypothetical protein
MKLLMTALRTAGLTAEQIVRVVEAYAAEQKAEELAQVLRRREQNRINQKNQRLRHRVINDGDDGDDQERKGSIPPKERIFLSSLGVSSKNLEEVEEEQACGRWNFDEFWTIYPHKVGKGAARQSFTKVQKSKSVSFADLMAGLRRYLAKTDDRHWCNPTTWLNQERWTDQPAIGDQNGTKHRAVINGNGHDLATVAGDLISRAEKLEREAGVGDGEPFAFSGPQTR